MALDNHKGVFFGQISKFTEARLFEFWSDLASKPAGNDKKSVVQNLTSSNMGTSQKEVP